LDKDPDRVAGLKESHIPFYEPGLEELVSRGVGGG
jgi:UDP-glucose 6-dehydrogenase